jgi:hypothetical protein
MATASVDRGMLWTDLEGRELAGGWRLKRLVRPEGRNAWFDAAGPDGKTAVVSLTEALNDEEELLARLRAAAAIHHPNVVGVRDARLAWVEGTPIVVAAMEATEENLAEVLRERALDLGEARLLLDGLLQGLAAIHAERLTHGRMQAGSVLATGNTVKLRSDCLRIDGFAAGVGEDVRGAGRIVTQAITRRIPANGSDPVLQLVPEPMGRAVRAALSGHATVEEVAALAGIRIARPKEPAQPRVPVGAQDAGMNVESPESTEKKAESAAAARPALVAGEARETAQMDLPLIPRWREEAAAIAEEEDSSHEKRLRIWLGGIQKSVGNYHRRGAPWVIATAVGLALATTLMLHGWLHRSPAVKAAAPTKVVVERAAPRTAAAPVARTAGAPRVWRVVVYTYRHRTDAAQRVRDLRQRYPQFRAGVMATRGGDFLVTLGGAMGREQAMALRSQAVRVGLPGDTYAQNFR